MKKLSEQEALEKIQSAAKEGKIEFASTDKIDAFESGVAQVLDALGHPEAFVSDDSQIWDFCLAESEEERLRELSEKLGIPIKINDYIWDIAFRLMDKEQA